MIFRLFLELTSMIEKLQADWQADIDVSLHS